MRRGRALDCELKQFRFAGNIMMEASNLTPVQMILLPLHLACSSP